jgi:hypothetical protein
VMDGGASIEMLVGMSRCPIYILQCFYD